jgi:hypothetical protein
MVREQGGNKSTGRVKQTICGGQHRTPNCVPHTSEVWLLLCSIVDREEHEIVRIKSGRAAFQGVPCLLLWSNGCYAK